MINRDYIVGLVDGEGSFTAYVRDFSQTKVVKRRTRIEPRFFLKLIEKDKAILGELRKFFGCGHVYFQKDNRLNHQNCYRFEVSDRSDLTKVIIPFFKKNQPKLVSKKKDFKIFCQLMNGIKRGEHLTEDGLARLCRLKQTMH